MAFTDNLPRSIVNDDPANRAATLIIAFLRQENRDAHEICVGQLAEKPFIDNFQEALGRNMRHCFQCGFAHRSIGVDQCIGHSFLTLLPLASELRSKKPRTLTRFRGGAGPAIIAQAFGQNLVQQGSGEQ